MAPTRVALKITFIYILIGAVWILFSDRALELFIDHHPSLHRFQTYKGWAYVAVTGGLFGVLAWFTLRRQQRLYECDELTGLLNWPIFRDTLNTKIEEAKNTDQHLALIMFNLDGFRQFNNQLGQRNGDTVLRAFADELRIRAPQSCSISRVAGDEFCIAVPTSFTTEELTTKVQLFLQTIPSILAEAISTREPHAPPTCSAGMAIYPYDAQHGKELITSASTALAEAKETGRANLCLFSKQYSDSIKERTQLIRDLRQALAKNELTLIYQPQFSQPLGPISSVEALVRWNHPLHGAIPPQVFVCIAEQNGMIASLTDFICKRAIEELTEAGLLDHFEHVSINVSALDINCPNADGEFARRFEQSEQRKSLVQNHKVQLEITETVLMHNFEHVFPLLSQLKSRGYRISIDDFGTGYSSLSVISKLPVDELKIDRSFVQNLQGDNSDLTIVRTIIAMAHALNLNVVAEGIETFEQLQILQTLKCDRFQGYFIAKPIPIEQLKELYDARHASS